MTRLFHCKPWFPSVRNVHHQCKGFCTASTKLAVESYQSLASSAFPPFTIWSNLGQFSMQWIALRLVETRVVWMETCFNVVSCMFYYRKLFHKCLYNQQIVYIITNDLFITVYNIYIYIICKKRKRPRIIQILVLSCPAFGDEKSQTWSTKNAQLQKRTWRILYSGQSFPNLWAKIHIDTIIYIHKSVSYVYVFFHCVSYVSIFFPSCFQCIFGRPLDPTLLSTTLGAHMSFFHLPPGELPRLGRSFGELFDPTKNTIFRTSSPARPLLAWWQTAL